MWSLNFWPRSDIVNRDVNGLDKKSTDTGDRCWICDSLPTVCQWFVNDLEINNEKQHYILEIIEIS